MTDRQARIEAAMAALFQGERGDVALGYYAVRSRMAAALEAAAADREGEQAAKRAASPLYRDPGEMTRGDW